MKRFLTGVILVAGALLAGSSVLTGCGGGAAPSSNFGLASAECMDGYISYSHHRSGTCSNHGGVREWLAGAPPN